MLTKVSFNPSLDFEYFVNLALMNKLPWDSLIVILNDWTPTLAKSKEVIEILVKELQKCQTYEEIYTTKLEGNIEQDDQTNEKLCQSQEFVANEDENQIFQESFEDDYSILDSVSEEGQFTEEFQDTNLGDESIEYDEKLSSEMLDRMGNQFDEFVGSKEIQSDNIKNLEDSEMHCSNNGKSNKETIEITKQQLDNGVQDDPSLEMSNSEDEAIEYVAKNQTIFEELQYQDLDQSGAKEKTFQCKTCEKCFKERNNLKRHERIHTGKTPFQCTICNKCFAHLSKLKDHESNHSEEKRHFKCNSCNKSFRTSSSLKVHELTHSSIKPFQCETCNKCFNRLDTLTRHHKTVHI